MQKRSEHMTKNCRERDLLDLPISLSCKKITWTLGPLGVSQTVFRLRPYATGPWEQGNKKRQVHVGKRELCAILVAQLNAAKLQRITRQKHLATCNAKQAFNTAKFSVGSEQISEQLI